MITIIALLSIAAGLAATTWTSFKGLKWALHKAKGKLSIGIILWFTIVAIDIIMVIGFAFIVVSMAILGVETL